MGVGTKLEIEQQLDFPHSLGLLYSAFTYYTGFKVNSGEYKLMGLAPYGEGFYTERILSEFLDLRKDGSFRLDMSYFGFLEDLVMTNADFDEVMGGPARTPEAAITKREMNIAKSIQEVTEEIVLRMARYARKVTGKRYLCMAGGVALNCVANGTAGQLYLCVRLGLVAEFERRSRALPLVMDDVLVNFDDERADAAANLLAAFAREGDRQLLFSTCNARTRELLSAADPQAELRELSPAANARS